MVLQRCPPPNDITASTSLCSHGTYSKFPRSEAMFNAAVQPGCRARSCRSASAASIAFSPTLVAAISRRQTLDPNCVRHP